MSESSDSELGSPSQPGDNGLENPDVAESMLARPMKPATKAALYTGPPRGGMLNFQPAVFRKRDVQCLQANDEERGYQRRAENGAYSNVLLGPGAASGGESSSANEHGTDEAGTASPGPAIPYDSFFKTWIEPNRAYLEEIRREFNWNVPTEDMITENQFFAKVLEDHDNNTTTCSAPTSNFSQPPHIIFDQHIGFLCDNASASHNCKLSSDCPWLYVSCFIELSGPAFRYFYSKNSPDNEELLACFQSLPPNALITEPTWEEHVRKDAKSTLRKIVWKNNWKYPGELSVRVLRRGRKAPYRSYKGFVNWDTMVNWNNLEGDWGGVKLAGYNFEEKGYEV